MVCMDEASKQLIAEVREPLPARPGSVAKQDSEYERRGTANVFMAVEPLAGKRTVQITDRRTKVDWALFIKFLLLTVYPEAALVVLVMDNLNTHGIGSLYEAFDPATARALASRLEIHHTPKHGSWLNMAEMELSALSRQCFKGRRIPASETLSRELEAIVKERNKRAIKFKWQFTVEKAREKLNRHYENVVLKTNVTQH